MPSKQELVEELEKYAQEFLESKSRSDLLASLRSEKTEWFVWSSKVRNIFNNLSKADGLQFNGLALLMEQKPESDFCQNQIKKFLIEKTEHYRYYDFDLEKKLAEKDKAIKELWITKFLRLFISRSFLGIILVGLILGFIIWFYWDRESCLEFVKKVVEPFLRAVK